MLGVFTKDGTDRQLQYKTAYYMDDQGNKEAFKYYQVSSQDLSKAEWLSNVEMQSMEFVIRTTYNRDFHINDVILIDGIRYMIKYVQKEMKDQDNGIFRSALRPFQFLTLGR